MLSVFGRKTSTAVYIIFLFELLLYIINLVCVHENYVYSSQLILGIKTIINSNSWKVNTSSEIVIRLIYDFARIHVRYTLIINVNQAPSLSPQSVAAVLSACPFPKEITVKGLSPKLKIELCMRYRNPIVSESKKNKYPYFAHRYEGYWDFDTGRHLNVSTIEAFFFEDMNVWVNHGVRELLATVETRSFMRSFDRQIIQHENRNNHDLEVVFLTYSRGQLSQRLIMEWWNKTRTLIKQMFGARVVF